MYRSGGLAPTLFICGAEPSGCQCRGLFRCQATRERISGEGCIYYWSGRPQGHLEGVAVAVANRIVHMATEAIPVNEFIMRRRITGVISLVPVNAPTAVNEFHV